MKKVVKLIMIGAVASFVFTAILFGTTHAQSATLSDAQISRIRSSCVNVENTLTQLHASDALLRVNRGQIYESMSTKLMLRFNDRASSNHYDISDLLSVTQNYGAALTTFRTDYVTYEQQLATAIATNCTKQPQAFYDAISLARTLRSQVHADVSKLNEYISDYDNVFNVFVDTEVTGK